MTKSTLKYLIIFHKKFIKLPGALSQTFCLAINKSLIFWLDFHLTP